jgi:predicted transglutaminase-like protease
LIVKLLGHRVPFQSVVKCSALALFDLEVLLVIENVFPKVMEKALLFVVMFGLLYDIAKASFHVWSIVSNIVGLVKQRLFQI